MIHFIYHFIIVSALCYLKIAFLLANHSKEISFFMFKYSMSKTEQTEDTSLMWGIFVLFYSKTALGAGPRSILKINTRDGKTHVLCHLN